MKMMGNRKVVEHVLFQMKEDFNSPSNTVSVAFWLFLWVRVSESTIHFLEVKVQD
jgi:hypothetical protein